jgi:hypothetical protein
VSLVYAFTLSKSRSRSRPEPVSANKNNSRNKTQPRSPRYTPLKRQVEADGIPYSSARDACFRRELPVLKIGGGDERYQRWYVTRCDW